MAAVRVAMTLLILLGSMWAAVGLFDSLTQVGIGLAVVGVAATVLGLVWFVEEDL